MYYSYTIRKFPKTYRSFIILLFVYLSFFTFPSWVFAEVPLENAAENYHVLGYDEQQKGNYGKALTYYAKAISLGLDDVALYNDIGIVYEHLGAVERAEEFYIRAISRNPNYLPAYSNLAYLYLDEGEKTRALELFKQRLSRTPEDDPWREKILQQIKDLYPSYKNDIIQKELEVKSKELLQKARDEFKLRVERSDRHYQKGLDYIRQKQFDKGVEEFDRALALTPRNPKVIKTRNRAIYEKKIEQIKARAYEAIEKLDAGKLNEAKDEFHEILTDIPGQADQNSE